MRYHVETMCRSPFIDRSLRIARGYGWCAIGASEYHAWAIGIVGSRSAWLAAVAEDLDARHAGCAKQTQLALASRGPGQTGRARMHAKRPAQAPNKPNFGIFSPENEGRNENKATLARICTAGKSKTQTPRTYGGRREGGCRPPAAEKAAAVSNKPNFAVFSIENRGRYEDKANSARPCPAGRSETLNPKILQQGYGVHGALYQSAEGRWRKQSQSAEARLHAKWLSGNSLCNIRLRAGGGKQSQFPRG